MQGELLDQIPNDLRVAELGGCRTLHDLFILSPYSHRISTLEDVALKLVIWD